MLSHFHLYGELRFPGVMGWRNSPSGLREDDDEWIQFCSHITTPVGSKSMNMLNISFCFLHTKFSLLLNLPV